MFSLIDLLLAFDNMMSIQLMGTLASLSLAASAFVFSIVGHFSQRLDNIESYSIKIKERKPTLEERKIKRQIQELKTLGSNLVKSFYSFVSSLFFILIADSFLEMGSLPSLLYIEVIDIGITGSPFAFGLYHLLKAASIIEKMFKEI